MFFGRIVAVDRGRAGGRDAISRGRGRSLEFSTLTDKVTSNKLESALRVGLLVYCVAMGSHNELARGIVTSAVAENRVTGCFRAMGTVGGLGRGNVVVRSRGNCLRPNSNYGGLISLIRGSLPCAVEGGDVRVSHGLTIHRAFRGRGGISVRGRGSCCSIAVRLTSNSGRFVVLALGLPATTRTRAIGSYCCGGPIRVCGAIVSTLFNTRVRGRWVSTRN